MTKNEPPKHWLHFFCCGLCMGTADIIPGISGGTVAFIMGIYEEFLSSIKSINSQTFSYLLQLKFQKFSSEVKWKILVSVLLGMGIALLSLAPLINIVLNHEIYRAYLYAGFFGLILASIIFCARHVETWSSWEITALVIGAIIAFGLTQQPSKPVSGPYHVQIAPQFLDREVIHNVDQEQMLLQGVSANEIGAMLSKQLIAPTTMVYNSLTEDYLAAEQIEHFHSEGRLDVWLIICGVIAISAMLLPGISGSYLLHLLGAYGIVIGALADLGTGFKELVLNQEAVNILMNVLLGILIGAIAFSRVISWCLNTYRTITLALLIGFMAGTLRTLWPFWSYHYMLNPTRCDKGSVLKCVDPLIPTVSNSHFWIALACAVGCFILVLGLEMIGKHKKSRTTE